MLAVYYIWASLTLSQPYKKGIISHFTLEEIRQRQKFIQLRINTEIINLILPGCGLLISLLRCPEILISNKLYYVKDPDKSNVQGRQKKGHYKREMEISGKKESNCESMRLWFVFIEKFSNIKRVRDQKNFKEQ